LCSPRTKLTTRTSDANGFPHVGEKQKMPTAFILLNTEIGAEHYVLRALKKLQGVQEAHSLWGIYDIMVKVQADSMETLEYIVTENIKKVGKINSKLTMVITEKAPESRKNQEPSESVQIIQ
jgi:DNA-binding Lrp family transcriptional regulator